MINKLPQKEEFHAPIGDDDAHFERHEDDMLFGEAEIQQDTIDEWDRQDVELTYECVNMPFTMA